MVDVLVDHVRGRLHGRQSRHWTGEASIPAAIRLIPIFGKIFILKVSLNKRPQITFKNPVGLTTDPGNF
jgi:hypothetical protein